MDRRGTSWLSRRRERARPRHHLQPDPSLRHPLALSPNPVMSDEWETGRGGRGLMLSNPDRVIELRRGGADVTCVVDPLRVEQVLVNLMDNAIEFSPPHSKVDVEVDKSEAGCVNIAVRDRGVGIARDQ